jgi:Anti-sigma-K factor rskA, C-terminal/Putative zinc-finger
MIRLTHDEIEELLGAYCLDAVDPDEREAIEAHLPECPRCRAEVAELREVAALLANNNADAPDGLWDRIAEVIDDTAPPMRLDVARRRRRDWAPIVLSAAAIVAILLLGWQVLDLRRENDRIQQQVAEADASRAAVTQANLALLDPGSRVVRLTGTGDERALAVLTEDGTGYMLAVDLPALDTGIYELWGADSNGGLTALGSMDRSGVVKFDATGDVHQLLVTAEPAFVDQPTTPPLMQGTVV